jgi:ankyrin repeat protein
MSKFLESCSYGWLLEVTKILESFGVFHKLHTPTALHQKQSLKGSTENLVEVESLQMISTGLIIASQNGHYKIVELLINCRSEEFFQMIPYVESPESKAIKRLQIDIDKKDKYGNTALTYACARNYEKIVELLINAGVNINSIDNFGRTPLIAAVKNNRFDIVQKLIFHKANIEKKDNEGLNALMYASKSCYATEYIAKLLLDSGANINEFCNNGYTPLMYSVISYNDKISLILSLYGADPYLLNNKKKYIQDLFNDKSISMSYKCSVMENTLNNIFLRRKQYLKRRMNIIREQLYIQVFHPRFEGKLWCIDEE